MAKKQNNDSFIFYTAYIEKFQKLTDRQFRALVNAMCQYKKTGELPELTEKELDLAFDVVKYDIDRNSQKYEEVCDKRQEAAQKKWDKEREMQMHANDANASKCIQMHQSDANASKCIQMHQSDANDADNDNENDNDNVNDNDTLSNDKVIILSSSYEEDVKSAKKIDYNAVKNLYLKICTKLPKIKLLTDARKKAIKNVLKVYAMEDIEKAFINAQESPFLNGTDDSGWNGATFDWLMKTSNMTKVLEGNYNERPKARKDGLRNDTSDYGKDDGFFDDFAKALEDARNKKE